MPILPTFIPLDTALKIASEHLNIDQINVLAMAIDGMCDSTIEAWGGRKGEVPHQLSPNFWIEFKYTGLEIGCDFIEIETLPFLIWLGIVPVNWRDLAGADLADAVATALKERMTVTSTSPQTDRRKNYEDRVAEFRKTGGNPPIENTKGGIQGDREWAVQNGVPRGDIAQWRRELLDKSVRGRPKNPAGNSTGK